LNLEPGIGKHPELSEAVFLEQALRACERLMEM
jgi:hypothetical protein